MSQSVFLQGFSLNIVSRSSLYSMGMRGIYTGMIMECEESGFFFLQNRAG